MSRLFRHGHAGSGFDHQHRRGFRATVAVLGAAATIAAVCTPLTQSQAAPVSAAHDPIAYLEPVTATAGHLSVHGWGFDPDRPSTPLSVDVTLDGKKNRTLAANVSRPDVARAYAKYKINATHGFTTSVPITDGIHTVCITAHNLAAGRYVIPGCRTVTVRESPLLGVNALTTTPGHLNVRGWSFDPDALTTPLTVGITLDGNPARTLTANVSRPDVTQHYASTYKLTNNHGFATSIPITDGTHTVCILAHNLSYGTNMQACRSITIRESPLLGVNAFTTSPGHLNVRGWSFDPDALTTPLTVGITLDGNPARTLTANVSRPDVTQHYASTYKLTNNHGFATSIPITDGTHTVCILAHNLSYGTNMQACRSVTVSFEPRTALTAFTATALGVNIAGWSVDPDTTAPIKVRITVDNRLVSTLTANAKGSTNSGHNFAASIPLVSGTHTVCATGVNVGYGTKPPAAACRSVSLRLNPIGYFDSLTRAAGSTNLVVTGWATDPDTTAPIKISITVDGGQSILATASGSRPDVQRAYPAYGALHGYTVTLAAKDGEHTVCITAVNVSLGANKPQGCREINAIHPTAPTAPVSVKAVAGYGGASVTWAAPSHDGGAPVSGYTVTSVPGNISVSVGSTARSTAVVGLSAKTTYAFRVTARNIVGPSAVAASPSVTTQAAPPAQTSPAPVSTSRYIRNIRGASAADLAVMRAEGVADAKANPSGHGYLILLDIGGQDHADGGVVLSATTRFVSYVDLVSDLKAYVDGYASAQKASAPITIAIGTNNDMQVTSAAGTGWADQVVDPVAAYAHKYSAVTIAGANDIEPGFRGTYAQTKAWLDGYLKATSAPFVFNGSADGCSWTVSNRACNNGWSMAGLYHLAAGASPVRTLNLPQIYNTAMASQWKYISLTGVDANLPRINFGGALTEWTACDQVSGCSSLTGHTAWQELWNQLQSVTALRVKTLPYSTDLRIDK